MSSYSEFKEDLRSYVLAGTSVTSLIGTRFYGAYYASLKDPTFPLGTFYPDPGVDMAQGLVSDFNMNVSGYADDTFDAAGDVYQAIRDRLLNAVVGETRGAFCVYVRSTPIEHYDEASRTYGITGKFRFIRIQEVGR